MNILLIHSTNEDSTAVITGQQHKHIRSVLRLGVGDSIKVGIINGLIGTGTVQETNEQQTILTLDVNSPPSPQLPLTLILALPRPQMIKRILQTVATLGIESLHLIQTSKVEKSFWQSPSVSDESIREHLILGLEQGVATTLPTVHKHNRFRPFIEDALPSITPENKKMIAHVGDYPSCPHVGDSQATTVVIGPEGGFIQNEVESFMSEGYQPVGLRERILKVETAVPVIISKLYY